jgi:hypothetical protein
MTNGSIFEPHELGALMELALDIFMFITLLSPGRADANQRAFAGLRTKRGAEALGNSLLSDVLMSLSDEKIASYVQEFSSLEKARKGKLDYLTHFEKRIRAVKVLIDKKLSAQDAHAFKRAMLMFGGVIAAASGSGDDVGIDQNESRARAAIQNWLIDQ